MLVVGLQLAVILNNYNKTMMMMMISVYLCDHCFVCCLVLNYFSFEKKKCPDARKRPT